MMDELLKEVRGKSISYDMFLRLKEEIKAEQMRLGVESQDLDNFVMNDEDLQTQIDDVTAEKYVLGALILLKSGD